MIVICMCAYVHVCVRGMARVTRWDCHRYSHGWWWMNSGQYLLTSISFYAKKSHWLFPLSFGSHPLDNYSADIVSFNIGKTQVISIDICFISILLNEAACLIAPHIFCWFVSSAPGLVDCEELLKLQSEEREK